MCGLLAGFGGVWKTWLKFVCDDVYVRSLVVKTPTRTYWRLLSVLVFGLTIVGLAWNELVRLNVNGIRVKSLE